MTATCQVAMIEYNHLRNWSFEDEDQGEWVVSNLGGCEQLYIEEKKTDSITGEKHYHFYSAAPGTVEFTLEQQVEGLEAGTYRYSISIMGGDGGQTDIYAYVKINGEIVHTAPLKITEYDQWHSAVIEGILCQRGDEIVVGIYVKCAGPNAWGKIDDAMFNSQKE
jgi:arabinogalactan endo-1,4-beta-galactosidase